MKRAILMLSGAASALLGTVCLVGCAPEHGAAAIPPSAHVLAQGQNMVSATPSVAGTVYVYDATDNRLVYSGLVNANDHVVVDTGSNVVTVNGATVSESRLHGDHQYQIEFSQ